jgi:hypothetical protein
MRVDIYAPMTDGWPDRQWLNHWLPARPMVGDVIEVEDGVEVTVTDVAFLIGGVAVGVR